MSCLLNPAATTSLSGKTTASSMEDRPGPDSHLVPVPGRGSMPRYVPKEEQEEEHLKWMAQALEMAEEAFAATEIPVGCVFVKDGKVIARARNRTNELMNATRHAELEAIDAILAQYPPPPTSPFAFLSPTPSASSSSSSGTHPIRDPHMNPFATVTLYVTVEPCLMCASALRQAGIQRVYYGAGNERFGGTGSVLGVHDDPSLSLYPPYTSLGGYYRDEAIMLLRRFYITENVNAPKPKSKERRVLKTTILPPGAGYGVNATAATSTSPASISNSQNGSNRSNGPTGSGPCSSGEVMPDEGMERGKHGSEELEMAERQGGKEESKESVILER